MTNREIIGKKLNQVREVFIAECENLFGRNYSDRFTMWIDKNGNVESSGVYGCGTSVVPDMENAIKFCTVRAEKINDDEFDEVDYEFIADLFYDFLDENFE